MLNHLELNEIKKHLNRGGSAIFVIGQGIDFNPQLSWDNPTVKRLYSADQTIVNEAWRETLSLNPTVKRIPFISGFTQYVAETAMVKLSRFRVLNTSISGEVGECSDNTVVINLNGLLHKCVSINTGVIEDAHLDKVSEAHLPAFIPMKDNYEPFADAVAELEEFVSQQDVRSVFFIGVSGKCPVVESVFNRSLVRATVKDPIFKCIININETYMDEEADLVIRQDATEFLEYFASTYPDREHYF
ncbi:hypothetical protein OTK49_00415 [Vibrio coralliirubri]|uniref:hypothetical protein n=1 Tax=Vibrio coralliirubri TaxID=1516159 RepID=UPI0022847ACA|nr:hypothetical protein [Vibrio coralliirubri]MCY9861004.1 hypothetical protein [Vibrio coralliirubri]